MKRKSRIPGIRKTAALLMAALLAFCLPQAALRAEATLEPGNATYRPSLYDAALSDVPDGSGVRKDVFAVEFTGGAEGTFGMLGRTSAYFEKEQQKYPVSVMLNAGSMGLELPYSGCFAAEAPDLKLLGSAHYDAAAIDPAMTSLGTEALASALKTGAYSGWFMPYLTCANLAEDEALTGALEFYSVTDYTMVGKYRHQAAVFGLIGEDALPAGTDVKVTDPVAAAKKVVQQIESADGGSGSWTYRTEANMLGSGNKTHAADLVICLANFGPGEAGRKQAAELAQQVPGIDLILLGEQTEKYEETVGDTRILSAGNRADQVGTVLYTIGDGGLTFDSFEVKKLTADDESASATDLLRDYLEEEGEKETFAPYGYTGKHVVVKLEKSFDPVADAQTSGTGTGLTDLITDAYRAGAKANGEPADLLVSILDSHALAQTLTKGNVTVKEAAAVFAEQGGLATDPGGNLTAAYLKGSDLSMLADIAAGLVGAGSDERLYFGGLSYTYDAYGKEGARVTDLKFLPLGGEATEIEADTNYRVVMDAYTAARVQKLLQQAGDGYSLRDEAGKAVKKASNIETGTVDGSSGRLKTWYVLASCLTNTGADGIAEKYAKPDGRLVANNSEKPKDQDEGDAKPAGGSEKENSGAGTGMGRNALIVLGILTALALAGAGGWFLLTNRKPGGGPSGSPDGAGSRGFGSKGKTESHESTGGIFGRSEGLGGAAGSESAGSASTSGGLGGLFGGHKSAEDAGEHSSAGGLFGSRESSGSSGSSGGLFGGRESSGSSGNHGSSGGLFGGHDSSSGHSSSGGLFGGHKSSDDGIFGKRGSSGGSIFSGSGRSSSGGSIFSSSGSRGRGGKRFPDLKEKLRLGKKHDSSDGYGTYGKLNRSDKPIFTGKRRRRR